MSAAQYSTSAMQSGYDINHLVREAQTRWLKPVEVLFILQNYEEHQLTHQIPHKPASGSLYLFNKRVLKFFRKDGHSWRKRKDQRSIAEAHERLKVGNVEALNCYYAHGQENSNFQRRSYWMLDPRYEHIVLVHYRDIGEGRQNARPASQFSPLSSLSFSPSPNSLTAHQPDSSLVIGESNGTYNNASPSSVDINSSEVIKNHCMKQLDIKEEPDEFNSSPTPDLTQTLRIIEHELSLNDDEVIESNTFHFQDENPNSFEDWLGDYYLSDQRPRDENYHLSQISADGLQQRHQEFDIWREMLDSSNNLPNAPMMIPRELDFMNYPAYSPAPEAYGIAPDCHPLSLGEHDLGISHEDNISLTIAQKQKFTIREISPDWCYTSMGAKVIIIGSFLCDPSECAWACMFGDTEVPVQVIQEGVICCHAPPHLRGKVTLCITSGNRESCSEVREFEYRAKPSVCMHCDPSQMEANKIPEEVLLLVRFVKVLLSDQLLKREVSGSSVDLSGKSRMVDNSSSPWIDALLACTSTPSSTLDWLLQNLLEDKLEAWISSKLQRDDHEGCSLSKEEQCIIHMVAGLGFEWALPPILNSGINIDFRDPNGWTALHWAARFGREKMVAVLLASGASAGLVTDPNSRDPVGKTPASIAAACGHKGLAGYLSEVALTSHLLSLTLEESELSKGSAALEAERRVNSLSTASSSTYEDQVSLKNMLNAVRNASLAAARIQSAFRAHSFRKRQQREAAAAITDTGGDGYTTFANNIRGFSGASKLAFHNGRDYHLAALSIQKKYRGWKGRKDFLAFRRKVVKIQAHVRGYQVRKYYKVCWATSILEKIVLRWRRRGVGLRGFRQDLDSIDESEDEDILKVFRKQKVDAAIDEAVSRVLSMVECPTARQQYQRLLEKYRQAKAERESTESNSTSSHGDLFSSNGISHVDK